MENKYQTKPFQPSELLLVLLCFQNAVCSEDAAPAGTAWQPVLRIGRQAARQGNGEE